LWQKKVGDESGCSNKFYSFYLFDSRLPARHKGFCHQVTKAPRKILKL
jgi:hypothetical protein